MHFYELLQPLPRGRGFQCPEIEESDRFGEYLGFVDIRRGDCDLPIAMALLSPPQYLRDSACTFTILGDYAPYFGAASFPCIPYAMHDHRAGGAYCAQTALFTQLVALADRGARIDGPYTLTMVAKRTSKRQYRADIPAPALGCISDGSPPSDFAGAFRVTELDRREMADALNQCDVYGERITLPEDEPLGQKQVMVRLIDAYLRARYPVIVVVDSETWFDSQKPWEPEVAAEVARCRKEGIGHAISIVGIRYPFGGSLDDAELIVHDSSLQPFVLASVDKIHEAARNCTSVPVDGLKLVGESERTKDVNLIFATRKHVDFHAYRCLALLKASFKADELRRVATQSAGHWTISLREDGQLFSRGGRYTLPRGSLRPPEVDKAKSGLLQNLGLGCIDNQTENPSSPVWCFDFYPDATRQARRQPCFSVLFHGTKVDGSQHYATLNQNNDQKTQLIRIAIRSAPKRPGQYCGTVLTAQEFYHVS
ncbi:MAG: hypothetical protein GXY55_17855 [Phycisphaerae bacterium]|nr:hypothetical protein [Phycisphaerae bacterium]